MKAIMIAKELGLNRFVCEQPPYNLLDRRIERELLPMAQTYGVATIPWSPLAGGLLAGKYSRDSAPPEGSRYEKVHEIPRFQARYTEQAFDVIEGLETLVQDKDCSLSQFALAWCMGQLGVTSPIIGPRTMEHLEDNLKAFDVTVTDEDKQVIDALIPPGRMVSAFYEANFGPHPYR